MARPKKPGLGRLEVRAEPWFVDLLTLAAKKTERSVSGYVRYALLEQLKRDGFDPTPPADAPTQELAKPVGRPKSNSKGKGGK